MDIHSNNRIKIRIKKEEIYITELANFLFDISQVDILLKAFEDGLDIAEVKKYFSFPLYFSRDSKFVKMYGTAKIADIKKGSLEIVLESIAILSSIVIPVIIYYAQKELDRTGVYISFEFDSDDQEIKKILEDYKEGIYGKSDESFDWMIELLGSKGYSIYLKSENAIILKKFAKNTTKRIIKTFRKY